MISQDRADPPQRASEKARAQNELSPLPIHKSRRGTRAYPCVDELLDAAVGESAEEAGPLAVARHALEGAYLVGAVEEDLDALAVDAHEHLARVALAAGPGDLEDLVGHGALELGHGERARVHVATPELPGEAVQDAARVLRDALDAGAPPQHGDLPARRRVHGGHRRAEQDEAAAAAICGGGEVWGCEASWRFGLRSIRGRGGRSGMPRNRGSESGSVEKAEAGSFQRGCLPQLEAPRQAPAMNAQWTRVGRLERGCSFH